MPKFKSVEGQTCPEAFQRALDALDVVGNWEWDAATDTVRVDAFMALLFSLDPETATEGIPLAHYMNNIHADDRERVLHIIRRSAHNGGSYLAEYRVCSADGQIRWVMARGRFSCDHTGRPISGRGILVEITQMRSGDTLPDANNANVTDPPLEQAAEHAIAAQKAIAELNDPDLKFIADLLLLSIGRELAKQQSLKRRRSMI